MTFRAWELQSLGREVSLPLVPPVRLDSSRRWATVLISVLLVFNACRERRAVPDSVGPSASSAVARGRADMARVPSWLERDDGQWLHPAKDYASTRFSSLDEINMGNAG